MKLSKCCVPGCEDDSSPRHRIPTNPRIRNIWLERIANARLQREITNLNNFRVCEAHFSNHCIERPNHLKKFSLPTLNLPQYNCRNEVEESFSFPCNPVNQTPAMILVGEISKKAITQTTQSSEDESLEVCIPQRTYGAIKRIRLATESQGDINAIQVQPGPSVSVVEDDIGGQTSSSYLTTLLKGNVQTKMAISCSRKEKTRAVISCWCKAYVSIATPSKGALQTSKAIRTTCS
ncbi:hypothetical protein RN001_007863 [Aquatica leii]|uniref:THAP-type domain-containing protein n=1 Tax=Aquatica leii TaxID=1421715 RepID=A0AAN7P8X8_9COLE|nr:hypothetical protein RN001_007863 [Aquatica leii]